nr:synaptobrevin, longin-like domain protein [Tanacetum cinerariifolium]
MSAKRTSWNEFSSTMASAVICLSTGRKFSFSKYIVDSLVRNVDSTSKFYMYPHFIQLLIKKQLGDLSTHTTRYTSPALTQKEGGDEKEHVQDLVDSDATQGAITAAQGDDNDVQRDDALEPTIPSLITPTPPPQPPQDLPSSSQGWKIDEMDKDDVVALMDDKEVDKKEEEAKDDEPAEVQEVLDVVTTAKLITEVVTAASETITAASTIISAAEPQVPTATITVAPSKDKGKRIMVEKPKPLKKNQQVEMDEEYARKLHAELNKDIDWDIAIEHVKQKAKEDPAGMSYDDIRPIFEAKFNSNIEFLLKTKEHIEEEESRALQSINETLAQKAAKRRKLNEEVEDLKKHLEIVPDEDDDVYTEATPLARKVPVV